MNVFFVKHGQTTSAWQQRLSDADEGLSQAGREEATRAAVDLASQLHGDKSVKIIASPRRRTLETAQIIAETLGVSEIATDERLVERDCAPYDGQLIADVFSKSEEELVAGGMEPLTSLNARTRALWKEVTAESGSGAILLVGHSGSLQPLVYAAHSGMLGDTVSVPELPRDKALQLI